MSGKSLADTAAALDASLARVAPYTVEPSVLQPAGLYLELAGEEIRRRAYMIEGEELCLRPDMTVPVCRAALAMDAWGQAFALRYQGQVFRRQSDAAAGAAEFVQMGVEFFAPAGQADEARTIAAALDACRVAGAEPALRLGDVSMFAAFVRSAGFPPAWADRVQRGFARARGPGAVLDAALRDEGEPSSLARMLASLSQAQAQAALGEMLAMAGIDPVGGRGVDEIAARLREQGARGEAGKPSEKSVALVREALAVEDAPDAALGALAALAKKDAPLLAAIEKFHALWAQARALARPPADVRFSIGLGRGISYYDGLVFELEAPALGARASLGGGGRYDGLLRALAARGGRNDLAGWTATGFAVRPKRLADAAA